MESNKNLFLVIKPESEKTKTILNNIMIMLGNRIYIDKSGNKQALVNPEEAINNIDDRGDRTYTIKTNNGDKYAIKIVFQRISATGKQSIVNEFFKEYAQYKKIIVAREFNHKIFDYVSKHQTQIFKENALLENIIDQRDQPKFELLSPTEIEKFKSEYNATDYTTKKMNRNDAIAQYYALRKGDIVRIIRPSPTSGEGIDYRIVT
jgi:DNA-directed RNA polymerase subunit H (RpoH/RPB5)